MDAFSKYIDSLSRSVSDKVIKLDSLSPLKVLTRGYSIVQQETGTVIKNLNDIDIGEQIKVTLNDGILNCNVISKEEKDSGKNS